MTWAKDNWRILPNFDAWVEAHSLVSDGMSFTVERYYRARTLSLFAPCAMSMRGYVCCLSHSSDSGVVCVLYAFVLGVVAGMLCSVAGRTQGALNTILLRSQFLYKQMCQHRHAGRVLQTQPRMAQRGNRCVRINQQPARLSV